MIEPGPVNTEFEMKLMADVSKKEFIGADPETLHHFRNCYLPTQVNLFQSLGQTPEDVAKVRTHVNSYPFTPRNITRNKALIIIPSLMIIVKSTLLLK